MFACSSHPGHCPHRVLSAALGWGRKINAPPGASARLQARRGGGCAAFGGLGRVKQRTRRCCISLVQFVVILF